MVDSNYFETEFNYFEELKSSLEDALAYKNGDESRCRVVYRSTMPEYDSSDVVRIRKDLGLQPQAFADALGVSEGTIKAWENGKDRPSETAQRLIYLFECDHTLIDRLISR